MAEINVERKHRGGAWVWVLGIIALALIIWAVAEALDRDDRVARIPPVVAPAVVPAEAAGDVAAAPITDIVEVVAVPVPQRLPLVGRQVQLSDVRVQSVVGDEIFWVGPSADQRLFVALDPAPGLNRPVESPTDVSPGQGVNVTGVVKRVPADLQAMQTQWKMDDSTTAALRDAQVYLAATQVAVVSRP